MKVNLSNEEYEFLKELQHELNTQETDGNAQPVFWGVEETVEECRGEYGDFGGDPYIRYDDGKWTLEEAIEEVNENIIDYPQDIISEWEDVDKTCVEDVYEFMSERLKWDTVYGVVYIEKVERVTPFTGAFLTKRACKNYIERYGYNHNNPHTYAMTAYRNFELQKLVNIIKNLTFEEN